MNNFKCYNCGAILKQLMGRESDDTYACYSLKQNKEIMPCYPGETHYNSWIRLSSENKIVEYSFVSLVNNTYYRIEAINNTTSIFYKDKVDNNRINFYYPYNSYHYNKYYPISLDYMNELPGLFDQLIKFSIFV